MRSHSAATVRAYVAAVLVVAAGAGMSVLAHDWSWFSRAGSLVVVIGIVLTSSQIIENNRRLRRRRQEWERAGNFASRDWASREARLEHSRNHDEFFFENERSGLYMLIAGTMIWGFGDLVGLLFIP